MRIDNWPLDRIMQLPDWCFGQRWPITVGVIDESQGTVYALSDGKLPDQCVIWGVTFSQSASAAGLVTVALAMSREIVTTDAEFVLRKALLPFHGVRDANGRQVQVGRYSSGDHFVCRVAIDTQEEYILGRFVIAGTGGGSMFVTVIVSGVPREVPDWLVLGQDKKL